MPRPRRGFVPLPGSERGRLKGSRVSGKLDPEERIVVTVVLRPRSPAEELSLVTRLGSQLPLERTYPTRSEFAATFGSTKDQIAAVRDFAGDNGLKVLEASPAGRSVLLSGTIGQFSSAFRVSLSRYVHPQRGTFRGRVGPVYLPGELSALVGAVLGLDNRPQARAHIRFRPAAAEGVSYTPPQVASLYGYPTMADGIGQSIGLIELGGGYSPADVNDYCSGLGIAPPIVTSVSVDGATNSPTGDPNGPDGEVLLDIEVAGTIAPKAQILVYFAPNTDAGFVDAVNAALHGSQGSPDVVSISWGSAESEWTSQGIQALDQAFQDAAALGVTVSAASGDEGSSDGVDDGLAHVDYPASSQYVLGCGGTSMSASGGRIMSQVVWDDLPSGGATGGGVSDVFSLPSWQAGAGVPPSTNPGGRIGRGVPDVAGDADPQTGYSILVDDVSTVVGGTSAVAPLWAALVALINQEVETPIGYINPLLYGKGVSSDFDDVLSGTNGAYQAGPGWSACTGWGSPYGVKLLRALAQGKKPEA